MPVPASARSRRDGPSCLGPCKRRTRVKIARRAGCLPSSADGAMPGCVGPATEPPPLASFPSPRSSADRRGVAAEGPREVQCIAVVALGAQPQADGDEPRPTIRAPQSGSGEAERSSATDLRESGIRSARRARGRWVDGGLTEGITTGSHAPPVHANSQLSGWIAAVAVDRTARALHHTHRRSSSTSHHRNDTKMSFRALRCRRSECMASVPMPRSCNVACSQAHSNSAANTRTVACGSPRTSFAR